MKKIIIFGATGDLGKYLVDYIAEEKNDYEIIAVGTRKTDYFEKRQIKYIKLDITRKEDFASLPKDVFAVIDLAGLMPARMEGYHPEKYIDVNIYGTMNILNYCVENNIDRIMYTQSFGDIKEYGEKTVVLKPDMPRCFDYNTDHTMYVLTKNFAVDMIKHYNLRHGIKAFIFRLPTIYLYSSIDTYFVDGNKKKIGYREIIDKAIKGETLEIWGDKNRKKDMIYVKDFCQMIYKALLVDINYGHYNVGTGIGISLEEQITKIAEVFNKDDLKSVIIEKPEKPNAPQYIMDISNAVSELGYHPKYDYVSMLKDMKYEMEKNTK